MKTSKNSVSVRISNIDLIHVMLIEKSVYLAFYDLVILGEHGSDSGHSAENQLF